MQPSHSKERLTPTSYVVLGTIALRGPSTPYDLKRAVGHSIGYFWPFPHAQLYSAPKRLTEAGLLAVTSEDSGRRRQVYDITEAGRDALASWLAEPTNEQMQVRDIAEMKLFFSELARPEDLRALAGQQVAQHRQRIAVYEEMMARFGSRPEFAGRVISLRLGLRIEYAALEFWTEYSAGTGFAGPARPAGPSDAAAKTPESGTVRLPAAGVPAAGVPAAEVADEVLADQDGGADAAEEEDQHPDGVQVGLDQPEHADDQPEQDDKSDRSGVSAAHRLDAPPGER
jgi:DNA-binding PadR family transcriptional regulator